MAGRIRTSGRSTELPIELEDVKDHLRVSDDAEDDHITRLIRGAEIDLESRTGLVLTWAEYIWETAMPRRSVAPITVTLPRGPVRLNADDATDAENPSMQIISEDGTAHGVAASSWVFIWPHTFDLIEGWVPNLSAGLPEGVTRLARTTWPLQVDFRAGVGAAGTGVSPDRDVPEDLKQWLRVTVAGRYFKREQPEEADVLAAGLMAVGWALERR